MASGRPVGFRAKQVILAVPQFIGARILAPWRAQVPEHLKAFRYSSWLTAHLTLRKNPMRVVTRTVTAVNQTSFEVR